MNRGRDTRLERLAEPDASADTARVVERCLLEARAKVYAFIADALTQAGIDPAGVPALRLAPHPDPLAADREELFEQFPASDDDTLAANFAAKIGDMAQRYQDGQEFDFAKASLAELFAWGLARRARRGLGRPGLSLA